MNYGYIIAQLPRHERFNEAELLLDRLLKDYSKGSKQFEEDGSVETYKIVTTMRGNSLEGLVSVESPIGKALMGHKAGDRVYVEVNAGYGYYLIIKEIEKNPDEADDKLRSF